MVLATKAVQDCRQTNQALPRSPYSTADKMQVVQGANEQFLGNGMTKDNTVKNPVTPFGKPRAGQDYGPVETFTYDKNPQTLGKLEQEGIVTRISLKA